MREDIFDILLDFVFPPKCGFCNEVTGTHHFICEKCRYLSIEKYINRCKFCGKISYSDICPECEAKRIYYEKLVFCNEYTEEFKEKIHLYKFLDKKYYYNFFSELIYERIKDEEFDVIVPVPISKERYKERGYNQAGLIAKKLSRILNKPYNGTSLVKVKNNERQSMQNFKERQKSIKNVFEIADNYLNGLNILLIDDIFATGSTVNECSRLLKKAGVNSIKVGVICISHILK